MTAFFGIVVLNKPSGPSSNQAMGWLKRLLGEHWHPTKNKVEAETALSITGHTATHTSIALPNDVRKKKIGRLEIKWAFWVCLIP